MNEALLTIKEKGIDLYLNEQRSIVCPFCQEDWEAQGKPGTWKPYRSMGVSRVPAGILYLCHRATCVRGNKGGLVSDTLSRHHRQERKRIFEPKKCNHPMEFVPEEILNSILEYYYIDKQQVLLQGFRYLPTEHRLFMPVFNREGYTIGGIAKTLTKGVEPKTILYRYNNVPMLHYPKGQEKYKGSLILVEDILSAVRLVAEGYRAASILGTHISEGILKLLISNEKDITLMLDGDASGKALEYKRKFSSYFLNFSVILLSNLPDPKELTAEQLKELLCGGLI